MEMACIICGSRLGDEYHCVLKGMTATFCEEHFRGVENFDFCLHSKP